LLLCSHILACRRRRFAAPEREDCGEDEGAAGAGAQRQQGEHKARDQLHSRRFEKTAPSWMAAPCMQTDKASMLDEIIDYVKFLQLQVKASMKC
jgi:hypothetical protein